MEKGNEENVYQEQGIITVYLPPMNTAAMFEAHVAIKTALDNLPAVKIDFRILTQKGMNEPYGGLGNQSGNPDKPA